MRPKEGATMADEDDVIDLATRSKTGRKKKAGRMMKETPADEEVRARVLENSGKRLLEIVEGLEDLADRMTTLREDAKTRMGAAKSEGYSTAAIRAVLKRRAATSEDLEKAKALDEVIGVYMSALGDAE